MHSILVHTLHLIAGEFPSPSNVRSTCGIFTNYTSWNFWITFTLNFFLGFLLVYVGIWKTTTIVFGLRFTFRVRIWASKSRKTLIKKSIALGVTCIELVQSFPYLLDSISWGKGIGWSYWRWVGHLSKNLLNLKLGSGAILGHYTFTNG